MEREIREQLKLWYRTNARTLPWRETRDPYLIWISEVVLQQTRVAQGQAYYERFVARFPDVRSLSEAEEGEVLKYWQGLGYYSRARSLHTASRDVMSRLGGEFPRTYEELLSLKGVGEYTASAIASFAYDLPHAVVDGNVYRVLSRLYGIDEPIDTTSGKRLFGELAQNLLDPHAPALHNQAVMEFGALQCVPRAPRCELCPLQSRCVSYGAGSVEQLPIKQGRAKVVPRYFHYFDLRVGDQSLLRRRGAGDIWQGLYEFPLLESEQPLSPAEFLATAEAMEWLAGAEQVRVLGSEVMPAHQLSHRKIYATFYRIQAESLPVQLHDYLQLPAAELDHYATHRLMELYLQRSR